MLGLVVGAIIVICVICCLISKRKVKDNNNDMSVHSFNQSNSYIHYNSPRYSVRGKKSRKASANSALTQSSGSFRSLKLNRITDGIMEDYYEHEIANKIVPGVVGVGVDDVKGIDTKLVVDDNQNNNSIDITIDYLHCHGNVSGNLTEIPGDITNATTRTLHGTTTSLCEQCLTPASPAAPPISNSEGTSTSLPATTVEVAKAALGMTNPAMASDFPVVCDSCLSPSKLGNTAKSLNLPNLRLLDLDRVAQGKVPNPVGIKTNPRVKNNHLNTLRDTMLEFNVAVLPNINERNQSTEDNSFDSLLSPSKSCDWLSGDPFGYSSGEESPEEDNEKMIKIQPKIKVKSSRTQSEGNYFDLKYEKEGKDRKFSYQDHKTDPKVVEIALALQPAFSNKEDLSKMPAFRISGSKFPFGAETPCPMPGTSCFAHYATGVMR